jgi:hypothetical protein
MFSSSESWDFNSTHVYGTHVPVEEPSSIKSGRMHRTKNNPATDTDAAAT